jgi:ABC-type transporter Mla subunit MlaD
VADRDLFGDVEERGRLKALMQPTRRVLGRVLRPYFAHQAALVDRVEQHVDELDRRQDVLGQIQAAVEQLTAAQAELAQALDAVSTRLAALTERQDEIDRKASVVAAVSWDHVALTRRLAVIEDAIINAREAGAVEGV